MLFNSYSFLLFFPIATLIYYLIPKKLSWVFMLVASYLFYMGWRAEYALLLAFATASTWVCALLISRARLRSNGKKLSLVIIVLGMILNLGMLFYYKYLNFGMRAISSVTGLFGVEFSPPNFDIILPVGISFFTLQALGYLFDVGSGRIECEKNPFKYALFVSFFPQLVAGPIERTENLLPQLFVRSPFDSKNVANGLRLMAWGYFQKTVIADRLGATVNYVFSMPEESAGTLTIVATLMFAVQIYCDFSGYSDIAIGVAQVLGIKLSENFKRPYFSTNFSTFWQRWHISLSRWLQDYLFVPLCWSRWTAKLPIIGKHVKNPPLLSSVLVVFGVSGLWHGASFNFVLWGLLQGFYRVGEEILHKVIGKPKKHPKLVVKITKCIVVFILWSFSLIFFRATGTSDAFMMVQRLFMPYPGDFATVPGLDFASLSFSALFILVLFIGNLVQERLSVRDWLSKKSFAFSCAFDVVSVATLLIFSVYGPGYVAAQFIYFQF